ncbi:hypothetical protein [Sphingomicrobium flavum]|uniref:hypothetical protein n=1 Tax=Sphingomicrobium flavum TaxID=1229164 RepID=UPI0021AD7A82|nr:hypothetical protein [Sphingomicrobium flavum]
MRLLPFVFVPFLAACATLPAVEGAPKGAKIGAEGFATVLDVRLPDYKKMIEPEPGYIGWEESYAAGHGISVEEARARLAAQREALLLAYEVDGKGKAVAADNYLGFKLEHHPDWRYVFFFKRDPQASLARFTDHPRFVAAQGGFSRAELDVLVKPWAERFEAAGILGGYTMSEIGEHSRVMVDVTREEYAAMAAKASWGDVPEGIMLEFVPDYALPSVDPRVAPFIRAFENHPTGQFIQLLAGSEAKIVLDDGCLRVGSKGGPLAYFHRSVGIGLDDAGYISLIDRATGAPMARVGEMMSWAGPNGAPEAEGAARLQAACGPGPVAHVGAPGSKMASDIRYGHDR